MRSLNIPLILFSIFICIIPLSAYAEIPDTIYKDHVYSIKSHYYDLESELEKGIKIAENTLSSASFENPDAKKKIDSVQSIRSIAWKTNGQIADNLNYAEGFLEIHLYGSAYNQLLEIDKSAYSLKDSLYAMTKKIKDARDLEKKYQESKKTCILFWCSGDKDTYSVVNSKIQDLESKLKTIESKLTQIELDKNKANQSFHKYEIADKNLEIKKLQQKEKQQQSELQMKQKQILKQEQIQNQQQSEAEKMVEEARKQQQIQNQQQAEIERKQREIDNKEQQRQQENQYLVNQKNIEIEKYKIIQMSAGSPLIRGLIKGQLNYYVNDLPSYSNSEVRSNVESLASWMDGRTFQGVKLNRVYDINSSDLTFNWAKDYQEGAIGRQIGNYLLIGLGMNGCDGSWKPFDGNTVYKIMWHEMGHAMGFAHSKDSSNIMYEGGTGNDFSIDYDKTINLKDGWSNTIPFCDGGGKYYYQLESDSKFTGFTVYVVPSSTSRENILDGNGKIYTDCGGSGFTSFSSECTVSEGSYLFIYNPMDTVVTSMNIKIKIFDLTDESPMNMSWDTSYQFFTSDYLDYVRSLFR